MLYKTIFFKGFNLYFILYYHDHDGDSMIDDSAGLYASIIRIILLKLKRLL